MAFVYRNTVQARVLQLQARRERLLRKLRTLSKDNRLYTVVERELENLTYLLRK